MEFDKHLKEKLKGTQLVGFCMGRVWHRYTTDTDFSDCTHTHIQCTCGRYRYHLTVSPVVCHENPQYTLYLWVCAPHCCCHLHIPCFLSLGFSTGTGKPVVFHKQVQWVWVRFWFLAHHNTLRTHTVVSQIFTVYYNKVRLIFCVLNLVFSLFFHQIHCVTPWWAGRSEDVWEGAGRDKPRQVGTNDSRVATR